MIITLLMMASDVWLVCIICTMSGAVHSFQYHYNGNHGHYNGNHGHFNQNHVRSTNKNYQGHIGDDNYMSYGNFNGDNYIKRNTNNNGYLKEAEVKPVDKYTGYGYKKTVSPSRSSYRVGKEVYGSVIPTPQTAHLTAPDQTSESDSLMDLLDMGIIDSDFLDSPGQDDLDLLMELLENPDKFPSALDELQEEIGGGIDQYDWKELSAEVMSPVSDGHYGRLQTDGNNNLHSQPIMARYGQNKHIYPRENDQEYHMGMQQFGVNKAETTKMPYARNYVQPTVQSEYDKSGRSWMNAQQPMVNTGSAERGVVGRSYGTGGYRQLTTPWWHNHPGETKMKPTVTNPKHRMVQHGQEHDLLDFESYAKGTRSTDIPLLDGQMRTISRHAPVGSLVAIGSVETRDLERAPKFQASKYSVVVNVSQTVEFPTSANIHATGTSKRKLSSSGHNKITHGHENKGRSMDTDNIHQYGPMLPTNSPTSKAGPAIQNMHLVPKPMHQITPRVISPSLEGIYHGSKIPRSSGQASYPAKSVVQPSPVIQYSSHYRSSSHVPKSKIPTPRKLHSTGQNYRGYSRLMSSGVATPEHSGSTYQHKDTFRAQNALRSNSFTDQGRKHIGPSTAVRYVKVPVYIKEKVYVHPQRKKAAKGKKYLFFFLSINLMPLHHSPTNHDGVVPAL